MRVIRPPARLRISGLAFLLIAPLVALQLALALRVGVSAVPPRALAAWAGSALVLSLIPSVALFRGRPASWKLGATVLGAWAILSLGAAFASGNPALGFFAVFLCGGSAALTLWMRAQATEAFFDPRLRWYQRLPQPIPGLTCVARIAASGTAPIEGDRGEFRVSRLSASGAFIFSDRPDRKTAGSSAFRDGARGGATVDLEFKFRDRWLRCTGSPVVEVDRGGGEGWGVRFSGISPDLRKNLGDFIEQIRGEGYVD